LKNNISVIGAGYVGLVTGACLSSLGNNVILVDKNKKKINEINNGKDPINEPNLKNVIVNSKKRKLIYATKDLNIAVKKTDITFIAVDTPTKNNKIDLSQIESVIKELSSALLKKFKKFDDYHLIVIKSTVLPGTSNYILKILKKNLKKYFSKIRICSNPEFLRQGFAVKDFLKPDRIVIGVNEKKTKDRIKKLYSNFKCPIIITTLENSELIKYISNSFLANLISFSNQISILCNNIHNTDVKTVLKALKLDKRLVIKKDNKLLKPKILDYLAAGSGYGGSCLPKDVKAINFFLKQRKIDAPLLNSIEKINNDQPHKLIRHFEKKVGKIKNMKIAVLGVSFKAESDDLRDSPALKMINLLKKKGGILKVWDPVVKKESLKNIKIKSFSNNIYKTIKNSECIFIATGLKQINCLDWKKLSEIVSKKVIYDSRNFLNKNKINKFFIYKHIGS
tara:strand:+ start:881 stop:2233 length:1353 start_codon:yes stop_codon:yes gene_type:complete